MKGQGGFARSMDAPTIMRLNGCFIAIWTTTHGLHLEVGKFGDPFTHPWGPPQQ